MVERSRWPNPKMWSQIVKWRMGGLKYPEIYARLSLSENKSRFGLEDVPSEDTIRKNVNKFLKSEKEIPISDLLNWIKGNRKDGIEAIDSYISKLIDDVRRAESLPTSYEIAEYGANRRWILDQIREADDELAKMEERKGLAKMECRLGEALEGV